MTQGIKKEMKPTGRKKTYMEKFLKSILDFADSDLWGWLRSGYVNKNTEAIMAAQNQTWMSNIDGFDCSPPPPHPPTPPYPMWSLLFCG